MTECFDSPAPAGAASAGPVEKEFDHLGRYLLPHPTTGDRTSWTRVTTWAGSIAERYNLEQWGLRMAVKGVAARPDLYALAAATPVDDKATLDRVAKDAKSAAAAAAGANLGTALHSFTAQVDAGLTPYVPEPWAADIAAYKAMLVDHGITILPALIERKCVLPGLGVAGTFDRIVDWHGLKIADLKTGQKLDWGWLEIAVQLALYSRATHIWDPLTRTYAAMPPVDQHTALVFHLPVGQATAEVYEVDIASGWEAAMLCGNVREWRRRHGLARILVPLPGDPMTGLHARIAEATNLNTLTALWAETVASGEWTPAHTEAARRRKDYLTRPGQGIE